MEDLFYFTESEVRLKDIARRGGACNYSHSYLSTKPTTLTLRRDKIVFEWTELNLALGDFEPFEEPQQLKLLEYEPRSSFSVTFRPDTLPELLSFLHYILEAYGGWVGCDDGEFSIVYDASTIHYLSCP